MSLVSFDQLPDHSRIWIFPADRKLTAEEQNLLRETVEAGLADWNAHGSPVAWGHQIQHDQFLVIGVDETTTALSGCSIDSATRRIKDLEARLNTRFLDNARVFYRATSEIHSVSRVDFRKLAEDGAITGDTVVFNNILGTMGEFRQGRWEVPARDSWHAQAFPVQTG